MSDNLDMTTHLTLTPEADAEADTEPDAQACNAGEG